MTEANRTRRRLRFDEVRHDVGADGRCRIGVALEWKGETFLAEVDGLETPQGRLRACAVATLNAVMAATPAVRFELAGIKSVRAFDGWVVVCRVNATDSDRTYRLLGSAACEEETMLGRCTARSVLDAINRVLDKHLSD